ncbi:DUF4868 domain-containing protein [Bacillus aerophilus]|uniref:Kiwa anti-phage protein KwaB-like domain-containing protein n=1 Tax=Bacillus safensis TaxID=561879 RepID=UPI002E1F3612|nr:DUF4868 domain-containing protein [Bacillus aerophilus]MED1520195.1 DUF4868 domain-containing protein [Bacillus safensis]
MNIENILTILNGLNRENLDSRLYFTRKKSNGKYETYSPSLSRDLQLELKKLVFKSVEEIKSSEQRDYSPIGSVDGCVETISANEINSFSDIISSLNNGDEHRNGVPDDEVSKLTFYCFKIFTAAGDILFFRRVTKFNKLKNGFMGRFAHNDFEKLNDTLIGIDPSVDLIVFEGEVLILNHISLERIFSISDQFKQKAGETLEIVEHADRIINFEQFREDCLADGRVTRALTKLLNEEDRMHQVFDNFDNVIRVIDLFHLNIDLTEGNTKLVYEDKSQLMDITRLMRDSFYSTYINNRNGIDEGV